MEKRMLGKTGMKVGVIAFGGIIVDQMTAPEAAEAVAEGHDRGVNYYDVAPTYGNAQYALGPALAPYRKAAFLACKTRMRTAKEAQAELEESLRALKTDYFDVYQLHGLDDPEEIKIAFGPGGAMETLLRAKESGLARHLGFTCHEDESALEILRQYDGFATMVFPINYAYSIQKGGGTPALGACAERGVGAIAIKALAHRRWAEKEDRPYRNCWYRPICDDENLARLALNYTLSQSVAAALSPGDIRMLRLALDIIEAQGGAANPLMPGEYARLAEAARGVEDMLF